MSDDELIGLTFVLLGGVMIGAGVIELPPFMVTIIGSVAVIRGGLLMLGFRK